MIETQDLMTYLQVNLWLGAESDTEKEYLAEIMNRLKERDVYKKGIEQLLAKMSTESNIRQRRNK